MCLHKHISRCWQLKPFFNERSTNDELELIAVLVTKMCPYSSISFLFVSCHFGACNVFHLVSIWNDHAVKCSLIKFLHIECNVNAIFCILMTHFKFHKFLPYTAYLGGKKMTENAIFVCCNTLFFRYYMILMLTLAPMFQYIWLLSMNCVKKFLHKSFDVIC